MCPHRPWEDDLPQDEDQVQSNRNGLGHFVGRWETRMALLEARIANVETRVERIEAKMMYLRKAMSIVCSLFFVTLAYAIWK